MDIKTVKQRLQNIYDDKCFNKTIELEKINYCLECDSCSCKNTQHDNYWIDGQGISTCMNLLDFILRKIEKRKK